MRPRQQESWTRTEQATGPVAWTSSAVWGRGGGGVVTVPVFGPELLLGSWLVTGFSERTWGYGALLL